MQFAGVLDAVRSLDRSDRYSAAGMQSSTQLGQGPRQSIGLPSTTMVSDDYRYGRPETVVYGGPMPSHYAAGNSRMPAYIQQGARYSEPTTYLPAPTRYEDAPNRPRRLQDILGQEPPSVLSTISMPATTSYAYQQPTVYRASAEYAEPAIMEPVRVMRQLATPPSYQSMYGRAVPDVVQTDQSLPLYKSMSKPDMYTSNSGAFRLGETRQLALTAPGGDAFFGVRPAKAGSTPPVTTYSEDLPRYIPSTVSAISGGAIIPGNLFDAGPTWTDQLVAQARQYRQINPQSRDTYDGYRKSGDAPQYYRNEYDGAAYNGDASRPMAPPGNKPQQPGPPPPQVQQQPQRGRTPSPPPQRPTQTQAAPPPPTQQPQATRTVAPPPPPANNTSPTKPLAGGVPPPPGGIKTTSTTAIKPTTTAAPPPPAPTSGGTAKPTVGATAPPPAPAPGKISKPAAPGGGSLKDRIAAYKQATDEK